MLKVAITGGIGSGKSVVCRVFEKLGIPVFDADEVAKQLINNNKTIKEKLSELFGSDVYHKNGGIRRKYFAEIIFNDKIALAKVNELIHPAVFSEFNRWAEIQNSPYVIQESAIIFENGHSDRFDKIITVSAPLQLKIERCMLRDGISKEKVLERMKNQLSDAIKVKQSDYVIVNDNKEMILPQIVDIHNRLI
ncbi:MAG: dephospho-CoA kinase [Prolixibacteraceae bacterium]